MRNFNHDILVSLIQMKMEARRSNLLFQNIGMHKEICISAEKLDNENAKGHLLWGPDNWKLVPNDKKKDSLTLNLEWVSLRNADIITDKPYFVRNASSGSAGYGAAVALAYRNSMSSWYITTQTSVPFEVAYICRIGKLTDTFINGPFAVGDKVKLSWSIACYEANSVGEIVGKYDKTHTWAIRMEDNFVILAATNSFRQYNSGEENA